MESARAEAASVLIESDWNLKLNLSWYAPETSMVLIESDWNLKKAVQDTISNTLLRINRIRLEFKVYSS